MSLERKSAIVTGGSLGIGRAITLALAGKGANVAFNYLRHEEEAKALVSRIEGMGRRGLAVKADVKSLESTQAFVERVLKEFGRLDILVCNAGINRDNVIWKMSEEEWDSVIETNLKGYFNYLRTVAPILREQKAGKIVNVASINGLRGKFGQSNYSASKGGIIALTKSLAKELGRYNINVNAVAPGLTETEMAERIPEDFLQKAREETVLGRLATPEDVANLVVFLCSEKARHITGEIIKVDGGQYI